MPPQLISSFSVDTPIVTKAPVIYITQLSTEALLFSITILTSSINAATSYSTPSSTRGSGFLNGTIEELLFHTLNECKNAADYVTKFRSTVTELKSFSTQFSMDENWFICLFQYNLNATNSAYCQSYVQEHNPFDLDGSAKYSLSYAMHHFQNTVANPSKITEWSLVSLAALGPSALVSGHDSSKQ